jgi:CHASE3 domain sensor protein
MSRRLPIKFQLIVSFMLIIILVTGLLGWITYEYNDASIINDSLFNHTAQRAFAIKDAQLDHTKAMIDMREFLFYGNSVYSNSYQEKLDKSIAAVRNFRKTSTMQITIESSDKLLELLEAYNTLGKKVIKILSVHGVSSLIFFCLLNMV